MLTVTILYIIFVFLFSGLSIYAINNEYNPKKMPVWKKIFVICLGILTVIIGIIGIYLANKENQARTEKIQYSATCIK